MARYTLCVNLNILKKGFWATRFSLLLLLTGITASAVAQQNTAPLRKTAAALQQVSASKIQEVRVLPTDEHKLKGWLQVHLPHANYQQSVAQSITLSNLQPGDLTKLQQCPWLKYIDRGNRQAQEELELKDSDLSANNISAVHALYTELNGAGLAVSIKENYFDTTDIDLKGRVLPALEPEEETSIHATTMATVIAGAGNSSPNATGVARAVSVTSSSFANLMPDDAAALTAQGVSVQNHSYGVGVENYYGLESMAYDEQALAYPQLLHVFSSGNSGSATPETGTYAGIAGAANLTGQFKTSKNTLSVGALDSDRTVGALSSVGPAHDGRIKPELVAHGTGGTSEAAAVVSGVGVLVQQVYAAQHQNKLPPAALVKAILINSADDVENPHPDFKSGYGNVDALGAVQTAQEQRYFSGSIAAGASNKFTLQIPVQTDELKVTLVWHDAAASPDAPTALVNDLDLRLVHTSSGHAWLPWVLNPHPHPDSLNQYAKRQADHLNNVEQVTLQSPAAGTYELQITGHNMSDGPQAYSIAYEYTSGISWTYPNQYSSLHAGSSNRLRWSGLGVGKARLEYKLSGSKEWILISNAVELAQPYFDWVTPDTFALAQVRLTTEKQTLLSPEFILAFEAQPAITLNCGNELLLQWPAIAGASSYQLYALQGNYLQPLLTTPDTVAVLASNQEVASYFAVSPVLTQVPAARSQAVTFNPDSELCYISNFLPRQLAMDSVLLDLSISTNYKVQEVALERWEQGAFKTVHTETAANQEVFVFHDPNPKPGLNRYRARVTTQSQLYYSQEEDVLYTTQNFIQAAPNPVVAGQDVQVVAYGNGTAQLQLYNLMGQLVYTSSDSGTIKTLSTAGLSAGVYILRLYTEKGEKLSTRLLIL